MLDNLNDTQRLAAAYLDSHLRIIAGAGSGKTRVLTYRMAYLIREVGVNPYSILAITFTNKAAKEMQERMELLLESSTTGALLCTIHSLCVRILRQHIRIIDYPASFSIMDDADQKSLLRKIYKELDIDSKIISYSSSLKSIAYYKFAGITSKEALINAGDFVGEKKKAQIYEYYINYQKEQFLLDFDDLLIKTVAIFENYPEILEIWQKKFQYIHVDEFQDVSYIEYRLVQLLTGENNLLCVVGDPDQTIYSFRGANVNYILDLEQDYSNLKTIYLNRNYRSTKPILAGANSLIMNNKLRLEKDLYTDDATGKKIIHYSADNEKLEAEYIIEQINDIISKTEGVNYQDFAVLYRANYLSRPLEQAFINAKMPYRIYGGLKFFARKEVKDAISYLQLMVNPHDLAFERVINTPGRGIGAKSIEKIGSIAQQYGISLYDACLKHLNEIELGQKIKSKISDFLNSIEKAKQSNKDLPDMFMELMNDIGYMEMLNQDQEDARIENLKELQNSMSAFLMHSFEEATLDHYLQEISLYSSQDQEDDGQFVSLMTIHMSKGLEFPYLFVIGLSENIFPSLKTQEESSIGIEEERRLAYVAFTRAMKQLFLLDSGGFSYVSSGQKLTSRFIDEIDDSVIEHLGKKAHYKTNYKNNSFYVSKEEVIEDNENNNWKKGELVYHDIFGKGVILTVIDAYQLEIAFGMPYGIKRLQSNHKSLKRK